jgi:pimeloyl-ACP methyl ester carboxylesterase
VTGDTAPVQAETRYAMSGDVSIAYQVVGERGPIDIVFAHGFVANLEVAAENPRYEAFFQRLAELGRVIRFDRRGMGLSDRVREVPTLETWNGRSNCDGRCRIAAGRSFRDLRGCVRDDAVCGHVSGAGRGPCSLLPDREGRPFPGLPWAVLSEEEARWIEQLPARWGSRELAAEFLRTSAPTIADPYARRVEIGGPDTMFWLAEGLAMRASPSPGARGVSPSPIPCS